MIDRRSRLRIKRRIRYQRRSIEKAGEQASDSFEEQVVGRWHILKEVRRFVGGWLVLVGLLTLGVFLQGRELDAYYLTQVSVDGGTYREGIVGNISNMNPIFATGPADQAAAKLQFNALFKYDDEGQLVGDLAKSYEINDDGTVYTVSLRDDVQWHDGEKFDADDVVFTYNVVQHPDTRSNLGTDWVDVAIQKKSEYVVTFALPNSFIPFPHGLAVGGIIPEHVLGEVDPSQLRGHPFNNTEPVGTGPFMFEELLGDDSVDARDGELRLSANRDYFLGNVSLDNFLIATYSDREQMIEDFLGGELSGISDLKTTDQEAIVADINTTWYELPLNNAVFLFYKTSDDILDDRVIRAALGKAIDQVAVHEVFDNRYQLLDGPILPDQVGHDPEIIQDETDITLANKLLDDAGWKYRQEDNDGFRYKGDTRLSVEITTQNSDDFPDVAKEISDQWQQIGVAAEIIAVDSDEIQQNNIAPHNYQALLLSISLGPDPDQFVYWHSSQNGVGGFNFTELSDDIVDESLASGRTRQDGELRAAKYGTFLERWRYLRPAYALYRPAYAYAQNNEATGFVPTIINSPEQRFHNVESWRINIDEGVRPY